jgi:hypothetical protein
MSSNIPDTHLSISTQDITPATPEQERSVGIRAASHAIRHGLEDDQLYALLQMLDVIKTVPGGRTDVNGRRKA